MERYDAEGGNSVEDKPDGNEEEKKSITEEAVTVVKVPPPVAAKPTPFPRNAKWYGGMYVPRIMAIYCNYIIMLFIAMYTYITRYI